ncbi:hypothetical protein [Leucobacter sp. NPDC077196]|uniref:hypothetical protein n=1 Tax=Leucobacter sp. NPDC077196 TaxID=3154959 RepID=UPI003417D97D
MRLPEGLEASPAHRHRVEAQMQQTCRTVLELVAASAEPLLSGLKSYTGDTLWVETYEDSESYIQGSFQAHGYKSGTPQQRDLIRLNIGQRALGKKTPEEWARSLLVTIVHELVHLYCSHRGIEHYLRENPREHTKQFAQVAGQAGLKVHQLPLSDAKYYTPDFTSEGARRYGKHGQIFLDLLKPTPLETHRTARLGNDSTSTVFTPNSRKKEPAMSEIIRHSGASSPTVQPTPLFGSGIARQTKREIEAINARAEIAVVSEQAHAFLASVAITNTAVLVGQAETLIRNHPAAAPYLETLVAGYAFGAAQRLNRGL